MQGQELAVAVNQAATALEQLTEQLLRIFPTNADPIGRIADALEAANNPVEDVAEKPINVGLDEATISPYEVNSYPIVRYQLPDKSVFVWKIEMVPVYEGRPHGEHVQIPRMWIESADGIKIPLKLDPEKFMKENSGGN